MNQPTQLPSHLQDEWLKSWCPLAVVPALKKYANTPIYDELLQIYEVDNSMRHYLVWVNRSANHQINGAGPRCPFAVDNIETEQLGNSTPAGSVFQLPNARLVVGNRTPPGTGVTHRLVFNGNANATPNRSPTTHYITPPGATIYASQGEPSNSNIDPALIMDPTLSWGTVTQLPVNLTDISRNTSEGGIFYPPGLGFENAVSNFMDENAFLHQLSSAGYRDGHAFPDLNTGDMNPNFQDSQNGDDSTRGQYPTPPVTLAATSPGTLSILQPGVGSDSGNDHLQYCPWLACTHRHEQISTWDDLTIHEYNHHPVLHQLHLNNPNRSFRDLLFSGEDNASFEFPHYNEAVPNLLPFQEGEVAASRMPQGGNRIGPVSQDPIDHEVVIPPPNRKGRFSCTYVGCTNKTGYKNEKTFTTHMRKHYKAAHDAANLVTPPATPETAPAAPGPSPATVGGATPEATVPNSPDPDGPRPVPPHISPNADGLFQCEFPGCESKPVKSMNSYRRHWDSKHSGKEEPCSFCDWAPEETPRKYTRGDAFQKHFKRHHSEVLKCDGGVSNMLSRLRRGDGKGTTWDHSHEAAGKGFEGRDEHGRLPPGSRQKGNKRPRGPSKAQGRPAKKLNRQGSSDSSAGMVTRSEFELHNSDSQEDGVSSDGEYQEPTPKRKKLTPKARKPRQKPTLKRTRELNDEGRQTALKKRKGRNEGFSKRSDLGPIQKYLDDTAANVLASETSVNIARPMRHYPSEDAEDMGGNPDASHDDEDTYSRLFSDDSAPSFPEHRNANNSSQPASELEAETAPQGMDAFHSWNNDNRITHSGSEGDDTLSDDSISTHLDDAQASTSGHLNGLGGYADHAQLGMDMQDAVSFEAYLNDNSNVGQSDFSVPFQSAHQPGGVVTTSYHPTSYHPTALNTNTWYHGSAYQSPTQAANQRHSARVNTTYEMHDNIPSPISAEALHNGQFYNRRQQPATNGYGMVGLHGDDDDTEAFESYEDDSEFYNDDFVRFAF